MKPIKLTMQAFGPYASKEVVDFTKLENKTMFVISGATGAGKTTIFDGISFAIYGRASGDDRNGPDLRSQFADDSLHTEVSLTFELRGKTYHIVRSPQQEKKKLRGEGTTMQSAKAELIEFKEEPVLLASNVREVDEKIQEIMKIDCHQFRQIMMIPQGEFRKLLTSDSKEKEKILQKLFHSEQFKVIEEKLKEQASALRKQVERSVLQRKTYIERIIHEDNESLLSHIEAEYVNSTQLLKALTSHISEKEDELRELTVQIKEKENNCLAIQNQINQAKVIEEQFETRDKLTNQKRELDQRKMSIEEIKTKVLLAKKAKTVRQLEQRLEDVKKIITKKQIELQNEKIQGEKLEDALEKAKALLKAQQDRNIECLNLQKQLNDLQLMKQDIYSYEELVNCAKEKDHKCSSLNLAKEQVEKEIWRVEVDLQKLTNEKDRISEAKVQFVNINSTCKEYSAYLKTMKQIIDAELRTEKLRERYKLSETTREDVHERVKKAHLTLEQQLKRWEKGQATLLAKQLQQGSPCPVCGSEHHPNPSEDHVDFPTEKEVKQAQLNLKKIEEEKAKFDQEYYQIKTQLETQLDFVQNVKDELILTLPSNMKKLPIPEIKKVVEDGSMKFQQQLSSLTTEINREQHVQNEIIQLHKKLDRLRQQKESYTQEYDQFYTDYIETKRDVTRLSEALPEDLRNEADYIKKYASIEGKLKQLENALAEAENQVDQLKQRVATSEGAIRSIETHLTELKQSEGEAVRYFEQSLNEMMFETVESYQSAIIEQAEIDSLEERIQAFREEYRSVSDRLKDLAEQLTNVSKPNIPELDEQLSEVTALVNSLQEEKNDRYHKIETNRLISQSIQELNKGLEEFEKQYTILGELADVCSGKNTYKLTFERYVLASYLDQILVAANMRLSKMTNGRFELLRKKDRSKGNVQSGLEMLVHDQYTGQSRHVKTLSGGESFKASLSLALGLADVVQSYSGGISMETMFVDEGFGTLDPESLEHAIETLIDIQSTGRLVGIISHVPELKERINARFEVEASQSGSKVKFYGECIPI